MLFSYNRLTRLCHRYWWATPLVIFVAWRIGLELYGQIVATISPLPESPWHNNPFPPLWARWDSGWYWSIVNLGYSLREGAMSNVTFFPLYPFLWKLVQGITRLPSFHAGLLTSTLLTCGAYLVLYRWVSFQYGKRSALQTLVALSLFPTSFFLISAYSESALLLPVALAFFFVSRGKWVYAAVFAAVASAARPVGILLWPVLLWMWWRSGQRSRIRGSDAVALVVLPPLGLLLFSLFLGYKVGDPLAWLHFQTEAGREVVSPVLLTWAYLKNIATQGEFWLRHLAEMVALLFVVLHLPALYRLHSGYALYALLNLLPSLLSNTFTSIQRFILAIVPLFVVMGMKRKRTFVVYCIVCAPLLGYSIWRFLHWQWAG